MDYKQTSLWRKAFIDSRSDASKEEQVKLSSIYEAMRERAGMLVAKIAADMPHMTIHNLTHLDALWEMASLACGDHVDLNPAEALVFGGAVLFHDAAMTLAAYPGGLPELQETTEWKDLHARHKALLTGQDGITAAEIENRTTDDALRLLHAQQAENLPKLSWTGPKGDAMYLIEHAQIRQFYGSKIGKIAYSHWWSVAEVEEELSGELGPLPDVSACKVDLLKVACLLRVADAMHLDQRRAPAFEFALTQPSGISADHWRFQDRMMVPFVQGDALTYTAQPAFEVERAEAWWTAYDALQMVDRELRDVDRVLRARSKVPFVVRRVEGVHSPRDLARTVETEGWTPVDSTVRVSDVPKIVATLGGAKLYGEGVVAPIREIVQNSLDAITARRRLEARPEKWGELKIRLEKREDGIWLSFEDNGVGMSTAVLTGPLIDFGNSFWRSSLAIREFPGLAASGMKARGRYGIGFFSIFILGDQVRVFTRRYNKDSGSAQVLEFANGIGSRPLLRHAVNGEAPIDGGTRVEVKLKVDLRDAKGLLGKHAPENDAVALHNLVATIAPASDVDIAVMGSGNDTVTIGAGDWLTIDDKKLLSRVKKSGFGPSYKSSPGKLVELRDSEGRIFGRAAIHPGAPWSTNGIVAVDGLAANAINNVAGILAGVETTASRNAADLIIPPEVLSAWASGQAEAIAASDITSAEKARAAAIVAACGGNVGELPILEWKGQWMTAGQFREAVRTAEALQVHVGEISHEDDDDVTRRQFDESFELDHDLIRTDEGQNAKWLIGQSGGNGYVLEQLIDHIVKTEWGEFDVDQETIRVGSVDDEEILRDAYNYSRVEAEESSDE